MITAARSLLRRLGVEVVRYAPRNFLHLRRPHLLADEGIDVVLDVGAHDGSWARSLRRSGYDGRIVSFEPLAEPAGERDPRWEWQMLALGDRDGTAVFHVSANRKSSSLMPMRRRGAGSALPARATKSMARPPRRAVWRPPVGRGAASSTRLFQAPHASQRPAHFGEEAPQDWQT